MSNLREIKALHKQWFEEVIALAKEEADNVRGAIIITLSKDNEPVTHNFGLSSLEILGLLEVASAIYMDRVKSELEPDGEVS